MVYVLLLDILTITKKTPNILNNKNANFRIATKNSLLFLCPKKAYVFKYLQFLNRYFLKLFLSIDTIIFLN